jgi:alkylation response protein AidB-like acyl-CoA dehydrogenase
MNFDLSQDQKMLADSAASFAKKSSPVTRMRKLRDDPFGYERKVWKQMGELGWLGLPFSEAQGGFGGSMVDVAILLEHLGSTLVPEPYLSSVILAGTTLARAGSAAQHKRFLEPLIAGDATSALAWCERQGRYDASDVATRAEPTAGGGARLDGEKVFVLGGHDADWLVVSARERGAQRDPHGVSLFVIARGAPGVEIQPIKTMDGQRAAIVRLRGAEVGLDARVGTAGAGAAILDESLDLGAAAACAEGLGIMQTVLRMTVDYLKTREQFGVKIGSFQALQHRAVDMFVEVELARSTMMLAAIKAADPDPIERRSAVSAAKTQLAVGGKLVVQQAIQLHGGIGVTDEHDVGLYFKRMTVLNALFGDEEFHVRRFGALPSFTADM